jgi:hypothetical protein
MCPAHACVRCIYKCVWVLEQVFGYADPNGWPGVRMGTGSHDNAGVLHGSLTLYDLSLGAVRIRLRALSPDGRDAIGEQSVEYFIEL